MNMPAQTLVRTEVGEIIDLCATCRFQGDCVYSSAGRDPVLQCESFDTEGAAVEVIEVPPGVTETAAEPAAGLCVSCEHRADCTLQREPGGVWHCEEYA